jgi:hypothetical protein
MLVDRHLKNEIREDGHFMKGLLMVTIGYSYLLILSGYGMDGSLPLTKISSISQAVSEIWLIVCFLHCAASSFENSPKVNQLEF